MTVFCLGMGLPPLSPQIVIPPLKFMKHPLIVAGTTVLLPIPLIAYGHLYFQRPPRTDQKQILFAGVEYGRSAISRPRPLMLHVVTVDLKKSGVKVLMTPSLPLKAQTTSDFLQENKLQIAVNASYFNHFYEKSPWDYYPHSGDEVTPLGEAITNGKRHGTPIATWPILCFAADNTAKIMKGTCPKSTINAVAGRELLVKQGRPVEKIYDSDNDKPYSRVAVGIDRPGEKLWLIVVDGKQPLYSEGITKTELAQIIANLGADKALNLDGGGSTTLVTATDRGAKVLNAPMRAKLPMNERPVANHIGFYAQPQ
jgi:exopolysaccharide biosynthesis protein